MQRLFIRTIKTWYGRRFAVVGEDGHAIEYGGTMAIFPYSKEGLERARELKDSLSN